GNGYGHGYGRGNGRGNGNGNGYGRRRVLAAGAAALLAGCGLAPSDAALTPVASDGVSGFGAATPIEICLGAARVVAPGAASGASGVCVGEGAAARACSG